MFDWIKNIFGKIKPVQGTEKPKIREQGDLESKFPLMRRVINAFENGKTEVDHHSQYVYRDGKNNSLQLTVGFGLTSNGTLKTFIVNYSKAKGKYSEQFKQYIPLITKESIVNNTAFRDLLNKAAKEDPIYRAEMDNMYYRHYFEPALKFFNQEGFTLPLSLMVILDSTVHSGNVLVSLRASFSEKTPKNGGREKVWLRSYCQARFEWLANHSKKILNGTSVRPKTYLREMDKGNWNMDILPINCNGVKVS